MTAKPKSSPPPAPDTVADNLLTAAGELRRLAASILARSSELVEIAERMRLPR